MGSKKGQKAQDSKGAGLSYAFRSHPDDQKRGRLNAKEPYS